MRSFISACVIVVLCSGHNALAGPEAIDLTVVHRIKAEAFERSEVMDTLFWLTDANGPRLTGSKGFNTAAQWSVTRLKALGASNVHLEKWGVFGREWNVGRSSLAMVSPVVATLEGTPKAFTLGTQGPVVGDVVFAPIVPNTQPINTYDSQKYTERIAAYEQQYKGTLKGKIVLLSDVRKFKVPTQPVASRYDDAKLQALTAGAAPVFDPTWAEALATSPADTEMIAALEQRTPLEQITARWAEMRKTRLALADFLRREGVLAILTTETRGEGGITFAEAGGAYDTSSWANAPTTVVVEPEGYNRLVRLVQHRLPVKVELDVEASFGPNPVDGFNVIAELPGKKKRDELVMVGAHLDSWHGSTGATDNAAGVAVMLEAFRLLKKLNLPLDRTVRLALWSGEEQGLRGSRAYVSEHFADPFTMKPKPEHAKVSAYFNLDNGAGMIRGVYLQNNDAARPVFDQWFAPFRDLGVSSVTLRSTLHTDHASFDAVGLPAFQFVQEPLEYTSRTHHSNIDSYDHAPPSDLMQSAAVMASLIYAAANRAEPLPRKPLPPPVVLLPVTSTTQN